MEERRLGAERRNCRGIVKSVDTVSESVRTKTERTRKIVTADIVTTRMRKTDITVKSVMKTVDVRGIGREKVRGSGAMKRTARGSAPRATGGGNRHRRRSPDHRSRRDHSPSLYSSDSDSDERHRRGQSRKSH